MRILDNVKDKFYQKIIKILIIFYSLFELVSFIKEVLTFELNMLSESALNPLTNFELFIVDWFVVLSIFILITLSIRKDKFIKSFSLRKILLIHIPTVIIFNILVVSSLFLYLTIIGEASSFTVTVKEIFYNFLLSSDTNSLLYMAMISIIYLYFYFNAHKENINRETLINSQLINAKHQVLKSQLEPHFIFNTLNNISSLMDFDIEKSQKSISNLGFLLREITSNNDKEFVTLKEEIFFLEKYIELLELRFIDDVIITKTIDSNIEDVMIPNFIIQPFIENSIKHGFSKEILKIKVDLKIFLRDNYLNIEIKNNGCYLSSNFEAILTLGRGVSNTNERLKIIYGKDFKFVMKDLKNKQGVISKIKIRQNKKQKTVKTYFNYLTYSSK